MHRLGEYQKAIEYFELALKTAIEKLGESHPYTLVTQEHLNTGKASLNNKPVL